MNSDGAMLSAPWARLTQRPAAGDKCQTEMNNSSSLWGSPIRTLLIGLAVGVALDLADPAKAAAQVESAIGTSSFTTEVFTCRSYPEGQDIIIERGERSRTLSQKAATRAVKRTRARLDGNLSRQRRKLAAQQKRMQKLLNSTRILLPKYAKEFAELRDELIPDSERRIATFNAQVDEVDFILVGIENCGKGPSVNSIGNRVVNGTWTAPNGDQWYFLQAVHVFDYTGNIPRQEICLEYDGRSNSGRFQNVALTCCAAGPSNDEFCAEVGLGPGQGWVGLGGKCSAFKLGHYDDDSTEVQGNAGKSTRVFLPLANGRCTE